MATFYFDGSRNYLFNSSTGDYHGQVEVTATRNESNNTFTISVTGIRAYSRLGWNFKSNWTVQLSGDGKTDTKTGTIGNSGNNYYTGWLPSSGYNSVGASITVNGTGSGSCPDVNLYFGIGNSNITWINAGVTTATLSTYDANIASAVTSNAGTNDRTPPTINVFTAYPKSTSKTTCTIKANVNSKYTIKKGTTSVGSGDLTGGTQITKEVDATAGTNTYTITVTKNSNNVSAAASDTSDNTSPTLTIKSFKPATRSTASLVVDCNYPYQYYPYKKSLGSLDWSSSVAKNTQSSTTLELSNQQHTLNVQAKRTDAENILTSKSASIDMRLPNIDNYSLIPKNIGTAELKFKTSYNTTWKLYDSQAIMKAEGINNSTTITKDVTVNDNCVDTYKLVVTRTGDYTPLYTEANPVSCNTIQPNMSISSVETIANTIVFTASTTWNGSLIDCSNWRYELEGNDTGIHTGTITTSSASEVTHTISDVPVGEEFKLRLYAVYPQNNFSVDSTYSERVTCKGVIQLLTSPNTWKDAYVYLYTNKGWKGAVPYIYTENGWEYGLNQ